MKRYRSRPRRIRKRILILCEGKTEKNYFQAIKEDPDFKHTLSAIHPKVVAAKNPTPEQVVQEAISRSRKESKQGNPYDEIWVVFDHDNHAHRQEAYARAESESFGIAFTAIAFEMWYLLHFVRSARAFSKGEEVEVALRKYYPDYEKARQNDFAKLKPNLQNGIENAEWLREQVRDETKAIADHNPWTDIDMLVRKLIESKNL